MSELASWYGPNFYGHKTADGTTLTRSTVGVAHKTLPLGPYGKSKPATRVKLTYGSRSVVVPVIDRGPYVAGRVWDLTEAAAVKLGIKDRGVVSVTSKVLSTKAAPATVQDSPATVTAVGLQSAPVHDTGPELGFAFGLTLAPVTYIALALGGAVVLEKVKPKFGLYYLGTLLAGSVIFNWKKLSDNFSDKGVK